MTVIRGAKHQCYLPSLKQGTVWRCDECGRFWKMGYDEWRRVFLGRLWYGKEDS